MGHRESTVIVVRSKITRICFLAKKISDDIYSEAKNTSREARYSVPGKVRKIEESLCACIGGSHLLLACVTEFAEIIHIKFRLQSHGYGKKLTDRLLRAETISASAEVFSHLLAPHAHISLIDRTISSFHHHIFI